MELIGHKLEIEMAIGDVCNDQGDIELMTLPTMEGRFALPFGQAFRAMAHGWRWLGSFDMHDDEVWIMVQRGGEAWRVRR